MYFFVEEKFPQINDFAKSVAALINQYHGVVFFDFSEIIEFLDSLVAKLKSMESQNADEFNRRASIQFIPKLISLNNWIDITVLIDDIPVCRIVKAKKETVTIEIFETEKEVEDDKQVGRKHY